MKADFFKGDCRKSVKHLRFGICDRDDKQPAFIDVDGNEDWIAAVNNENGKEIVFRAIDNCILIHRDNGEMENRCDAMLTHERAIFLVELKTKRADWKTEGLEQIEPTIKRLMSDASEFYDTFTRKKAVVVNRRYPKPTFQKTDTERREYFWKEYRFRLQFEADIVIR